MRGGDRFATDRQASNLCLGATESSGRGSSSGTASVAFDDPWPQDEGRRGGEIVGVDGNVNNTQQRQQRLTEKDRQHE